MIEADTKGLTDFVGTHRVQRVPEGANRRHTSTVTVAILDGSVPVFSFSEDEVDLTTYRGSGPGGQHRNKVESGVRARHVPSGIVVTADTNRSWWNNRQTAMAELRRRLEEAHVSGVQSALNTERVDQIGIGDRPSHDWTWCAWRDEVTCHTSGRRMKMSSALRGRF